MSQIYWHERADAPRRVPALFLDRDGVVVEEVHYLHRRSDVRLLGGARALIGAARTQGWAVGLVTNQAGIGRGYYGWADFMSVQDEIVAQLGLGPDPFDFTAACGAHPEASGSFHRIANHSWRKPNPGMIKMAAAALDLDLAASVMAGDQISDLEAGLNAGLARVFHIRTGHGAAQRPAAETFAGRSSGVVFAESLAEVQAQLGWPTPAI